MKICLDQNERLFLETIDKSFVVKKYRESEKKAKVIGYYGTLDRAIVGVLDHKMMTSEATSIQELLNEIRTAKKELIELLKL